MRRMKSWPAQIDERRSRQTPPLRDEGIRVCSYSRETLVEYADLMPAQFARINSSSQSIEAQRSQVSKSRPGAPKLAQTESSDHIVAGHRKFKTLCGYQAYIAREAGARWFAPGASLGKTDNPIDPAPAGGGRIQIQPFGNGQKRIDILHDSLHYRYISGIKFCSWIGGRT